MKKEIYTLVGPASIGKTTFLEKAGFPKDRLCIVSRDEIVARVSEKYNLSFDDLYHFPPHDSTIGTYISGFEKYGQVIESPFVVKHLHPFSYEYLNSVNAEINYAFYNEFQTAIRNPNIDYIAIDRVHLRRAERNAYFHYLEFDRSAFVTCAVLFNFEDPDALDVIALASEYRTAGMIARGERFRTVKRKVQEDMIKFYEPIIEGEFDSVIKVNTLPEIREFIHRKYAENNFDESGECPYCKYKIIQLRPLQPDTSCRYERNDPVTDNCPSCKKTFKVYEDSIDFPEAPTYHITRYQTEKL